MTIYLILTSGILGVLLGRFLFGRWFNHVSLYSGIWGSSLVLFECRLIDYYPLEPETWLIIAAGWISFVCGSLVVVLARWACGRPTGSAKRVPIQRTSEQGNRELGFLKKILWVTVILTLSAALHDWYVVVQKFGSISNTLVRGALLYSLHVSEGIPGKIPYLSSLSLSAALLGGIYTAKAGKLSLVAIAPLFVCVLVDLSNMSRALMVMAAIIFCTGYSMTGKNTARVTGTRPSSRLQRFVMVMVGVALLIVAGEFVRSTRHANEDIVGASTALKHLQGASFITPTIYMYLTVHHGVLNQYLMQNDEKTFLGANTFASIYRVLSKIGFDTYVNAYQRPYNTPVPANTGTYLRELHADFGLFGVLFAPFLIGCLASYFWYRFLETQRYVDLAVLGYFQVIIAMSVFYLATLVGYLLVYLIGALVVATIIDRKTDRLRITIPSVI